MRLKTICLIAFVYILFAFTSIIVIQAEEPRDWVDVVGEHIGGWKQMPAIDLRVDENKKAHIKVWIDDVFCNEYFMPDIEKPFILYRKCGQKEWKKLD